MEIIEKELKYRFSSSDYLTLMNYFLSICVKSYVNEQVNYYIDTPDMDLIKYGISIRLRIIDDISCEFTIKSNSVKQQNNVSIKKEFNADIDINNFTDIIAGASIKEFVIGNKEIYDYVIKLGIDDICLSKLNIIGQLKTIRNFYQVDGVRDPVNLDFSEYEGQQDYELEWETEEIDNAKTVLTAIFNRLGIEPSTEIISKRARFTNALLKK